jgi:hypothetical protein
MRLHGVPYNGETLEGQVTSERFHRLSQVFLCPKKLAILAVEVLLRKLRQKVIEQRFVESLYHESLKEFYR